jgi:AraC-like DNA-binding protein
MKQGQEIVARFPGILIIHQKMRGKKKGEHQHDEHEIFIPLQGEIGVEFDDFELKAGAGKMIYIPPGVDHRFSSSKEAEGERLYFFIDTKTWDKLGGSLSAPKVLPASQLCKELLFHLLIHPQTRAAKSLCETLVQTFAEMLENVVDREVQHLSGKVSDPRIKKVLEKIQATYHSSLLMEPLARDSGLSVRSLNRLFLDQTGMTPKQAVTLHRIEEAKSLLAQNRSVTDVAYDVGYRSLSQFITTFRSVTGKLPTEFKG